MENSNRTQKCFLLLLFYLSVNLKPPRHRFGFSLAWGWQLNQPGILAFTVEALTLPTDISVFPGPKNKDSQSF